MKTASTVVREVDISIIIVTWNVAELLLKCIQSIERSKVSLKSEEIARDDDRPSRPLVELIVVDSDSSDDTLSRLSNLKNVRAISCANNVGYAKGNNIGLFNSTGKYVLFLNPDTEIIGDAISVLWRLMQTCPELGVIGPDLRREDGGAHLLPRTLPSFVGTAFEASLLVDYTPQFLLHRESLYAPEHGSTEVEWVLGAALMAPRKLMEDLGGFDERFLMYSEEKDLCIRVRDRGYKIRLVGDAKVTHLGGRSSEQRPIVRHALFWQSHLLYFRKHKGRLKAEGLRLVVVVNYFLESIKYLVKATANPEEPTNRAMFRLCWRTLWAITLGSHRTEW